MSTQVIELLDHACRGELHAILTYMSQSYKLLAVGRVQESNSMRKIAMQEMNHMSRFATHIRLLDGIPSVTPSETPKADPDLDHMYAENAEDEASDIYTYSEYAQLCFNKGFNDLSLLFQDIIQDEKKHKKYFSKKAIKLNQI